MIEKYKFTFHIGLVAVAMVMVLIVTPANAYKFKISPNWDINLDNTLQYTLGWRAQKINDRIGNSPTNAESEYKFKDRGDLITNRIQDLIEFQVVHKRSKGLRFSASLWKDFAYDDDVETNPGNYAPGLPYSDLTTYLGGKYSNWTKRYHVEGGELLDAFLFYNTNIGDIPLYFKVGRLTQYWGNAFFFGFSNIGYSQHPVDYIKGFSQPGSEVKELFLPRTQVLVAADLTPELSVALQYFFEWHNNRYPEGGTFLAPADITYDGPELAGIVPLMIGMPLGSVPVRSEEPADSHSNFGVKVYWSPEWAKGDIGIYYREFDETHPWVLLDLTATPNLHLSYANNVKLFGLSYERSFGLISTGFEASYRKDTGLNSTLTNGVPGKAEEGATGDIINLIANTMIQLKTTPFWQTGVFIGELTYTHLDSVSGNKDRYNGVGYPGGSSRKDGSATDDAIAFGMLFDPQWLQVFPGVDINAPMSLTWGLYGNPAYTAGGFYAKGTLIWSVGIKATYHTRHSLLLQYNGYHWDTHDTAVTPSGLPYYSTGNGAWALNDKGWFQIQLKTSF